MSHDSNLLKLERDFMRALREPVFGESRELTPLAERAGDVSEDFHRTAERHIRPSRLLAPVERLELYHRQYWFRLLDSIAEDFPTLRRLLGDEPFWKLIEAYLESMPSRSYTLRHLGSRLAEFIAEHPELAGNHITHAIELARLEYAACEAFEAEDLPVVEAAHLADSPLQLQPHVKLFAFATPVDTLWHLPEDEASPDELLREAHPGDAFHVAVFREHYQVRVERLPSEAFRLLRAIEETHSLEAAMDSSGLAKDASEECADRIREWFGVWTARGWLCAATTQRNSE